MLKKEFKRKDVDRARNLIMGKSGASSETQVGYKKKRIEYKEGDVWKENGKTWTIKDGIKGQLDKPNYRVHKMCLNCVVEFEHKLQIEGKYEEYERQLFLKNRLTRINEMENYFLDLANQSNEGYVSENGEIERWKGGVNKEKFTKDITQAAKEARKDILTQLDSKKD